jgi:hypothetical protein
MLVTPHTSCCCAAAQYRLLMEPATRRKVLGPDGMGVAEEMLELLDLCLAVNPKERATIKQLKQLPVCQRGYKGALSWPHITRRLPQKMVV